VVAAIMGRLGLGGCLGERDIVMGKNPLLNCGRGRGCHRTDNTVTDVIAVTSVIYVNLSRICN
jgi:hypothetical protein